MQDGDKPRIWTGSMSGVDDQRPVVDIIAQVAVRLRRPQYHPLRLGQEAREALNGKAHRPYPHGCRNARRDGYDLLRWLRRRRKSRPVRPAILVTGHNPASRNQTARDCAPTSGSPSPSRQSPAGARVLVRPDERMFVDCPVYAGPDRRFKFEGPPPGRQAGATMICREVGACTDATSVRTIGFHD